MKQFLVNNTVYRERDRQKRLIYEEIASSRETSRKDITVRLEMRATSVSDIVQELLDDGIIAEDHSKGNGKRGRPELCLRVVTNRLVCISIYAEDNTLIGSLLNLAEETLAEESVAIAREIDNRGFLKTVCGIVERLKTRIPPESELVGVGISTVGTVDSKRKNWIGATRWPSIRNIDFHRVESVLGATVNLRRWLDTELEYQLMRDPACRKGNALLFHWGTGIGAAFSHDGVVLDSLFGKFSDIGHIFVDPSPDRLCHCGRRGCLEAVAAIWALAPLFRKYRPEFRETIRDVESGLKDEALLREPEMEYAIHTVGIALANLLRILLPNRVFFIGPFLRNPFVLSLIKKQVGNVFEDRIYKQIRGKLKIDVVRDQMRVCKIANVRPFFDEKLEGLLKAKQ